MTYEPTEGTVHMKGWKLEGAHLAALRAELEGDKAIRRICFVPDDGALEIKVITPGADEGRTRVWLSHARAIPFGFHKWRSAAPWGH